MKLVIWQKGKASRGVGSSSILSPAAHRPVKGWLVEAMVQISCMWPHTLSPPLPSLLAMLTHLMQTLTAAAPEGPGSAMYD
eukprot:1033304-Pelagomonas_calceolata.AAC.5